MKSLAGLCLLAVVVVCGCSQPKEEHVDSNAGPPTASRGVHAKPKAKSTPELDEWVGVYSSPDEIGGFTGTVLAIEKNIDGTLAYRKSFHSDVGSANAIEQDLTRGSCLIEENRIYIPEAFGYYRDNKPNLLASIDRYVKVMVNNHVTLMRDDAYAAFQEENKLYDYGILIKVSDKADWQLDLGKVEHKSIKVLYSDKTKEWKDPFVSGPNER